MTEDQRLPRLAIYLGATLAIVALVLAATGADELTIGACLLAGLALLGVGLERS